MSRSGIDEFYEIIRVILAKFYSEREGYRYLPTWEDCNCLLTSHGEEIGFILDGVIRLQTPPDLFHELQYILDDADISGQDFHALDQVFEQLTSRSYKADKGQYFTPRHVIDMCVEAVDPQPGELVCDPACGSGAFLKSAHSYALSRHGQSPKLFGFDYSHRACQVAKTMALLTAGGAISVSQLDSLRRPSRRLIDETDASIETVMGEGFSGFDVIVTNPPFAGDVASEKFVSDYDMAALFPRRLERDVLFIERCIGLLKVGGRLAIVLPDNKVSGRAFRDLRLWMSKRCAISSVVSLHRYTFLPHTSQKAAVIFATRQPTSMRPYDSEILFFRSDRPGKSSNGAYLFADGRDARAPHYQALDHDLREIAPLIRASQCS